MSGTVRLERLNIGIGIRIDAEIDDLETGAFHHHADEVLADVVNVAFDGADDHLANRLGACFRQYRLQYCHAGFHCICGKQYFRHEQDAVTKIFADDVHAADQRFVQHFLGTPATAQQDLRAFGYLVGKTVVKIIVHLFGELVISKLRQNNVFVSVMFLRHTPFPSMIDKCLSLPPAVAGFMSSGCNRIGKRSRIFLSTTGSIYDG